LTNGYNYKLVMLSYSINSLLVTNSSSIIKITFSWFQFLSIFYLLFLWFRHLHQPSNHLQETTLINFYVLVLVYLLDIFSLTNSRIFVKLLTIAKTIIMQCRRDCCNLSCFCNYMCIFSCCLGMSYTWNAILFGLFSCYM